MTSMFTRWRSAMEERAAFRDAISRTTRELDSYSTSDLAELGLSPGDIPRVARETAEARFGRGSR